jgi:hypothetical protein
MSSGWWRLGIGITAAAALSVAFALSACGDRSDSGVAGTRTGSPAPASPATATQVRSEADLAFAAAIKAVDGVAWTLGTPCHASKACVVVDPDPDHAVSIEHGLASFLVGDAEGVGGYNLVLGRDASGHWQYWYGTQQDLEPLTLPGDMRICTRHAGLPVRTTLAADSSVVATLTDETIARADEFVLTQPGSPAQGSSAGKGSYRISAPVEGWVDSQYAFNPESVAISDCTGLPTRSPDAIAARS